MKKRALVAVSVLMVASMVAMPASAGQPPEFPRPGEQITFEQKIPINIVFVGYDRDMIDEADLLDDLPATYTPVVRYPQFYGLPGRDMGLKFDFSYHVKYAGGQFEDKFFNYLTSIGQAGDPTLFQTSYNDMANNVLDVTGPVLYIDAPSVEKWLMSQAHSHFGIDTNHSYTLFFINWYSRPDFKFHVYTKYGTPDPDTGYDFGLLRASRKMIAWGGSHGRAWFYDLSAGPESWSSNYDVDNPDLDGNGVEDYRMPAIWEYTAGGYRDLAELSNDLGLVTRFVGIDLLFTTSPLYDPLVTSPDLRGGKVLHVEMFEDDDDPASDGTDWIDTAHISNMLRQFQPYYKWTVALDHNDPIDADAQRAFHIFTGLLAEDDCWNPYLTPFAELFCYFDANLAAYIPAYGAADYVGEVFAFHTTAANLDSQYGLLGFADDNWVDGTQSYVFEFDSAEYRSLGYGFSTTTVHEFGHHIGMSHPHDGYDSEYGIDYGPGDDFYFAWSGDESNTVMHYMDLSYSFGQFDQDNMYRYEFAGYLNWANALVDDILAHPDVAHVRGLLNQAAMHGMRAVNRFEAWDYLNAARHARHAYERVVRAAEILGIPTSAPTPAIRIAPGMAPHEGDPIRYPDN